MSKITNEAREEMALGERVDASLSAHQIVQSAQRGERARTRALAAALLMLFDGKPLADPGMDEETARAELRTAAEGLLKGGPVVPSPAVLDPMGAALAFTLHADSILRSVVRGLHHGETDSRWTAERIADAARLLAEARDRALIAQTACEAVAEGREPLAYDVATGKVVEPTATL
jgi:hypothetical protein